MVWGRHEVLRVEYLGQFQREWCARDMKYWGLSNWVSLRENGVRETWSVEGCVIQGLQSCDEGDDSWQGLSRSSQYLCAICCYIIITIFFSKILSATVCHSNFRNSMFWQFYWKMIDSFPFIFRLRKTSKIEIID